MQQDHHGREGCGTVFGAAVQVESSGGGHRGRAEAARHKKEIAECAKDPSGDVTRCLMGYGWAEARALATEDSLWGHDAANHRQQVATCTRQRKMQAGSCLQLYYKWNPARALAVDDSIRRAQMRR